MARIHITQAFEALDLIVYREYGLQAGAVEPVLEANPHISDIAHDLPAGTRILLPDLAVNDRTIRAPKLWD